MGCASTGGTTQGETQIDDVADIDELLGLADSRVEEGGEEDAIYSEDDVLKLLGVQEESEPATTQPATGVDETPSRAQLQQMDAERKRLNKEEQDLRAKVAEQENTLAGLQNQPGKTSGSTAAPIGRGSTFNERYQDAFQSYRGRRYRESIQKFEALLTDNYQHELSDNCQYWIGESYYGLGIYQQAIVAFQKVFTFTNTNKSADSQLKLGLCYMRLKDYEKAKVEFQKLIDNYPASESVGLARRYISQME